jgi:hypothetical protein
MLRQKPLLFYGNEFYMPSSNGSLLNKAQCKKFALRWAKESRTGWKPDRVSKQFIDDIETKVRLLIQSAIKRHPTVGKTIKDFV